MSAVTKPEPCPNCHVAPIFEWLDNEVFILVCGRCRMGRHGVFASIFRNDVAGNLEWIVSAWNSYVDRRNYYSRGRA